MTQNLFENNSNDQLPQFDPSKNYVEELVGEGKKFKTIEDLAKGKAEADAFIAFKNREYDTLKEDYLNLRKEHTAGSRLEDLITKLSTAQQNSSNESPSVNEEEKVPAFKLEDIDARVNETISRLEMQRKETANFNEVQAKLQEKLGPNYENILKQQVSDLGLSPEDVNTLAKKSPKAFFKTLGLEEQSKGDVFNAPPRSQNRSDSFSPSTTKRTWNFYEKMRKENPSLYLNPKTQVQMHKDHRELGNVFEDGDFNN
jgi:hypothetical protein